MVALASAFAPVVAAVHAGPMRWCCWPASGALCRRSGGRPVGARPLQGNGPPGWRPVRLQPCWRDFPHQGGAAPESAALLPLATGLDPCEADQGAARRLLHDLRPQMKTLRRPNQHDFLRQGPGADASASRSRMGSWAPDQPPAVCASRCPWPSAWLNSRRRHPGSLLGADLLEPSSIGWRGRGLDEQAGRTTTTLRPAFEFRLTRVRDGCRERASRPAYNAEQSCIRAEWHGAWPTTPRPAPSAGARSPASIGGGERGPAWRRERSNSSVPALALARRPMSQN